MHDLGHENGYYWGKNTRLQKRVFAPKFKFHRRNICHRILLCMGVMEMVLVFQYLVPPLNESNFSFDWLYTPPSPVKPGWQLQFSHFFQACPGLPEATGMPKLEILWTYEYILTLLWLKILNESTNYTQMLNPKLINILYPIDMKTTFVFLWLGDRKSPVTFTKLNDLEIENIFEMWLQIRTRHNILKYF